MSVTVFVFNSGQKLQNWPRLKKYILSCQAGEKIKKADTFTYDELVCFAQNRNLNTKYWQVRKAIVAFAFFGGHRTCELRQLNINSVKVCEDGVEVTFPRAKQRKDVKDSKYLIPKLVGADHYRAGMQGVSSSTAFRFRRELSN